MAKLNKKQKPMKFKRGYEIFHQSYKNPRTRASLANCFSCDFFYQAEGDICELCQNPDVLKYDLYVANGRVFCSYWKGVWEDVRDLY